MAAVLDCRIDARLPILISGMMLASGRRTVSSWLVAAGVADDWDRFYDCLSSVGRKSREIAVTLLTLIVATLAMGPTSRFLVAVDDTPTKRYGKRVEGAGVYRDPTPGPAGGDWCFGHCWVVLAVLANHTLWGVIALPLLSMLYIREVDLKKMNKPDLKFRTKHQLGAELVIWFVVWLRSLGQMCKVWLVADGAYAASPFLKAVMLHGVVVISRLRKDAALYEAPAPRKPGQRGRPRIYGDSISLAKRAAHRGGWQMITYNCRGVAVTRKYKAFLAMSKLTGAMIRVVVVQFDDEGWLPYFCTDITVDVRDILEAAAARWAIEETFHDVKEVWGAGQQQVRRLWSSIGCWHLNLWLYTLVELASWNKEKEAMTDRSDRPWDNPSRRPSHADRRSAFQREMLDNQLPTVQPKTEEASKIWRLAKDLIKLCI
jgi:hypothetical protein